ncbi:FecR family protein [Filimonas effusa]|uniref:FecR family protein n=1 Tax=Filimonas effusa TaxID=2508721 RepID=A0A4Q1D5B4_9BACT|nr:FecR family protein [Filimonas effusa]RXK83639.1 FecR family protein [Filimonas effusa]
MHVSKELIRRFFEGQCSENEAKEVARWLEQHPEAMDEYYNEEEWKNEPGKDLPDDEWNQMWASLEKQKHKQGRTRIFLYAAAACISIVALFSYLLGTYKIKADSSLATAKTDADDSSYSIMENHSDTTLRFITEDSTVVMLAANASIRYSKLKWKQEREILLNGEASFDVAKDKTRPFVVYTHGLAVKALGTLFSVKAGSASNEVKVRLYEGKVLVTPDNRAVADKRNIFSETLSPGQELVLDKGNTMPYVQYFLKAKEQVFVKRETHKASEQPLTPSGWFEFTSQQLDDVFSTLEVLYGVDISYRRDLVQNMFFIGRFEPTDSIEYILNAIALLNDLHVKKKAGNRFEITGR